MTTRWFIPPGFQPLEAAVEEAHPGDARRWIAGWNGLIGKPAEQVLLGWSTADATARALVGTRSATTADEQTVKIDALLALRALTKGDRLGQAAELVTLATDGPWEQAEVIVDGTRTAAHVLRQSDGIAGHAATAEARVAFAITNLTLDAFGIQSVPSPTSPAYEADPMRAHSEQELRTQLPD